VVVYDVVGIYVVVDDGGDVTYCVVYDGVGRGYCGFDGVGVVGVVVVGGGVVVDVTVVAVGVGVVVA